MARYRVRLFALVIIGLQVKDLLIGTVPRAYSLEDPLGLAGIGLVALGLALRSWAASILKKSEELATSGPYALARHPLYVGNMLLVVGVYLVVGRWENLAVAVTAFILLYAPLIRREESRMAELFGEQWEDYIKRTGMFYPKRISALKHLGGGSAKRLMANREYIRWITAVSGLAAIAFWRRAMIG
jgi:protein-S-isoprenylcysteine O-methyltransferase Ste14